ncbi:unknown similar to AMEV252 [Adoxophyes honmai entomopoxvirus 'L']|uniref:Uncharacterized protein n=1 Tax=Adoxophyes honmai entomopoxvirus 'L' TaxID=1293540 RepID=A0A916KPC0_9POXV|nr:unknown similar to AMEV252 [Adoxophyes honmai entomopoxvirus 'L']CCU55549.1 unknown similar to AMEV252 [Adoxophyes honmai entomopoxvirus 'L']
MNSKLNNNDIIIKLLLCKKMKKFIKNNKICKKCLIKYIKHINEIFLYQKKYIYNYIIATLILLFFIGLYLIYISILIFTYNVFRY